MKISDLDLDSQAINFLHSEGYDELFEPQEQSVKAGLFDEKKNFLITIPTASGKTLIAMLAILSHLSKHKTKVVYLTPLRALTSEKFEEFKKLEKLSLGRKIKVALSTGDSKEKKEKLEDADVIFLTNESMDANMAFQQDWIYDIGLVVSDEIHLIGDDTRGPTLEIVLTRLRSGFIGKNPPKIIGLSATISNSNELADWLDCELVESTFRRVPLSEAVYSRHIITNQDREETEGNLTNNRQESRHQKDWIGLGLDTVDNGDQCLIFAMTRKNAVAWAKEAGRDVVKMLTEIQRKELEQISKKILPKDSYDNTKLTTELAHMVKNGTAFHHAGLDQRCRSIIETEFRNGHIKLLSATPTLAAGVNLPARRVVIPSVMRYTNNGLEKISILEYKQMCGRAGRPQYDDMGESIIIAKGYPDEILEYYVDGIPEPLESKTLDEDSSLRINLLGYIYTSSKFNPTSYEKIIEFFSETFAAYQLSNDSILEKKISKQLEKLKEYGMIIDENGFEPTKFGIRVFYLRIDPRTAFDMTGYIEDYVRGTKHTFGILHMITNLAEFYSQYPIPEKYQENMDDLINKNEKLYTQQKFSNEDCFKSLLILYKWIDAMTYQNMSEQFDAEPGDIFYIKENAKDLVYSFTEIVKFWRDHAKVNEQKKIVSEYQHLIDESDLLKLRIIHGVPEKYLELIKIKQIGRVRAQVLYKNGYKDKTSLKKVPLEKLAKIDKIGLVLAKNIKSQLENSKK
ncbi:MAG: RNA helicase [Thaumarchaeota archaeon]|jgi:helicase|nr:RNA helicase [Nitrososphaerota archaeon]